MHANCDMHTYDTERRQAAHIKTKINDLYLCFEGKYKSPKNKYIIPLKKYNLKIQIYSKLKTVFLWLNIYIKQA
jgi:hypothetical protein